MEGEPLRHLLLARHMDAEPLPPGHERPLADQRNDRNFALPVAGGAAPEDSLRFGPSLFAVLFTGLCFPMLVVHDRVVRLIAGNFRCEFVHGGVPSLLSTRLRLGGSSSRGA